MVEDIRNLTCLLATDEARLLLAFTLAKVVPVSYGLATRGDNANLRLSRSDTVDRYSE